jgi:hypothetical protein
MKVIMLYRPGSEHASGVEAFLRDLLRQHDITDRNIRQINVDSREGISLCSIYDIMSYPGVVVTTDEGGFIKSWEGTVPLMGELMSYAYSP